MTLYELAFVLDESALCGTSRASMIHESVGNSGRIRWENLGNSDGSVNRRHESEIGYNESVEGFDESLGIFRLVNSIHLRVGSHGLTNPF